MLSRDISYHHRRVIPMNWVMLTLRAVMEQEEQKALGGHREEMNIVWKQNYKGRVQRCHSDPIMKFFWKLFLSSFYPSRRFSEFIVWSQRHWPMCLCSCVHLFVCCCFFVNLWRFVWQFSSVCASTLRSRRPEGRMMNRTFQGWSAVVLVALDWKETLKFPWECMNL